MSPTPPFAQQRILFFALPLGVVVFAVAIGVMHADPELSKTLGGDDLLGAAVWPVAAGAGVVAFGLRRMLQAWTDGLEGPRRRGARMRATLLPLAVLEGGALFALVAWLLSGKEQPGLVAALVLLAAMLALVPLRDPDEEVAR